MDPSIQDVLDPRHPRPVRGTERTSFRATCLNVQHSVASRIPQLENFLREQGNPAIVLLTEAGKPPPSMALDTRYHRFSNPVKRGQIGTAILLRRDSGTTVHREVHHPGGRGLYIEATVLGHEFWVAVLYCPSRPMERWEEVVELVQWATSRTLTRPPYAHGIVG